MTTTEAWSVGTVCHCVSDSTWYKAKIRQVSDDAAAEKPYLVHFDGWAARHDVWVDASSLRCGSAWFGFAFCLVVAFSFVRRRDVP